MSVKDAIDRKWEWMLANEETIVRRTVEAAARFPSLRRLFPYASHQNLWFSRKTEYPYDRELPHIRYEYEKFHAVGCDNSVLFVGKLEDVVFHVATAMEGLHLDKSEARPR